MAIRAPDGAKKKIYILKDIWYNMYSSGCGRRGPSVPRRYYALLLTTADKPIVRSTVRKNINYKDYPNN